MMYVSMFQVILELEGIESIKDKRNIVKSLKDAVVGRFRISCSEIDLVDSLAFAHMGGAYVSNSGEFAEKVIRKAVAVIEEKSMTRIHDLQVRTECVSD